MGEIVNLRRARKQRDRRAKEEAAQAKRGAVGRTKSERELTAARAQLDDARLEAHRRARDTDEPA